MDFWEERSGPRGSGFGTSGESPVGLWKQLFGPVGRALWSTVMFQGLLGQLWRQHNAAIPMGSLGLSGFWDPWDWGAGTGDSQWGLRAGPAAQEASATPMLTLLVWEVLASPVFAFTTHPLPAQGAATVGSCAGKSPEHCNFPPQSLLGSFYIKYQLGMDA